MPEREPLPRRERIEINPAQRFVTIAALGMLGIAGEHIIPGYSEDFFGSAAQTMLNATINDDVSNSDDKSNDSRVRSFGRFLRNHRRAIPITTSLTGNSLWELGQGIHAFPGTFDVKDFIAYIGGALLWLGIDKVTNKSQRIR